jgi:hypothetical protein
MHSHWKSVAEPIDFDVQFKLFIDERRVLEIYKTGEVSHLRLERASVFEDSGSLRVAMHLNAILPGLYISSWFIISQPNVLERAGITRVLTVMEGLDYSPRLLPFKRMIIPVDDEGDEPMIDYFDSANKWIDEALADGGKVMIH